MRGPRDCYRTDCGDLTRRDGPTGIRVPARVEPTRHLVPGHGFPVEITLDVIDAHSSDGIGNCAGFNALRDQSKVQPPAKLDTGADTIGGKSIVQHFRNERPVDLEFRRACENGKVRSVSMFECPVPKSSTDRVGDRTP